MVDDSYNWNPIQGKSPEIIYQGIKDSKSINSFHEHSEDNLLHKFKEFFFPTKNPTYLPPEPYIHQKYN